MDKQIYVVWKKRDGGLAADTFEINGPINHNTVEELVRDSLSYYTRDEFHFVISWQIEED